MYIVFLSTNCLSRYQLIAIRANSSRGSQHLSSTPLCDLLMHRLHHSLHSVVYASSTPANHKRKFTSRLRHPLEQAEFVLACEQCPKEFFKALFIVTSLGAAATRMSHAKVAPEGLKPQECERNAGRSRPPIPYIPEKDVLQEAVDSSANTLKLTLPHKV